MSSRGFSKINTGICGQEQDESISFESVLERSRLKSLGMSHGSQLWLPISKSVQRRLLSITHNRIVSTLPKV